MNAPRLLLALALAAVPQIGVAQDIPPEVLSFSVADSAGRPAGWGTHPTETVSLDSRVLRSTPYAARLERTRDRSEQTSTLTYRIPVAVSGSRLELRGWLRTADVEGFAGLWLRQDAPGGSVQFDNMQSRRLAGTTEWTEYRISLPLDRRARSIYFGALLVGNGTVWVDDLELLVDGRPLEDAPRVQAKSDVLATDREFAAGSRIETTPLTSVQVGNLALLGRVWGLAKYHHPRITGGGVHWDFELFRVLPDVLAAGDRTQATSALSSWLARLGDPAPCSPCAQLPSDPHLLPPIEWIRDTALLGNTLSEQLQQMHRNRPVSGEQYFVSHLPGVGNPDFMGEPQYPTLRSPDAGYRLLSLFRLWNIIEYWFPYRDLLEDDWTAVLAEFVPRLMAADGAEAYRLELMQLIARVYDTHANLWGELHLRPPVGPAQLPVTVRFIDDRAVVTGYAHAELGPATGLLPGDVIEALDGARVDSLVKAWRPYYAASNQPTRLRDIAGSLSLGAPGSVRVSVRRGDGALELAAARVPEAQLDLSRQRVHDLPGETFQRLTEDVAYLKLSSVELGKVPEYVQGAAGAKVLVIDIRNYPSAFMVFALGGRLVSEPTEFARFTVGDASNPGAFTWTDPLKLQPLTPRFEGRVVVLVDEVSQSQAEYTAMAFRAAGATIVGSTTAGADGNISPIPLPGGTRGMISGIGVFYPDRSPTQRVGIIPDLEVRPTLEGIRAGRDEVLEAAVSYALGREFRLPAR